MSHDPDKKIELDKKAVFKHVRTSACLYKEYPTRGKYVGGIVFRRYYGIGSGIGFTKEECEKMWGEINLDDHIQFVHKSASSSVSSSGASAPQPVVEDLPPPRVTSSSVSSSGASAPQPTGEDLPPPRVALSGESASQPTVEDPVKKLGKCLEVYWNHDDEWFPCIIKDHGVEEDGTTVYQCVYDDGHKCWHNLQQEEHRPVDPTVTRLKKVSCRVLQILLKRAGVSTTGSKAVLIRKCLMAAATTATTTTTVTPTTTTSATATTTATPTTTTTNATATTAATPTTTTTSATATTAATPTSTTPGTCLEVYWNEEEVWFPCIVKRQQVQADGTTTSLCAYDDGVDEWHNLQDEDYRPIEVTEERLKKVTCRVLRSLLQAKGVDATGLKKFLIRKYLESATTGTPTTTTTAPTATVTSTTATTTSTTETLTTDIASVDTMLTAKCKFGQTHAERMVEKRKRRSERSDDRKRSRACPPSRDPESFLTATQACASIERRAHALYTLATRGEGDSYSERDEFNLITLRQSDLIRWGSDHVWQPGCADMSHLPEAVTAVRNVNDWSCVNTYADGDRVVFKRAAPTMRCRGCGAARRRKKFMWTDDMSTWFHNATKHLSKKCIPFVSLAEEAEKMWGYSAPEQEHLENRIKSRDQARKEGREVKWARL